MNINLHFVLPVFLFCITIQKTRALDCYQCNSNEDAQCSEFFNHAKTDLKPTFCNTIYEAKYCVKATGLYAGVIGTQRFCSSRHHGNQCYYVQRPGDERYYRSCIHTCYRDGCNKGSGIITPINSIIVLFLSLALFRFV